MNAERKYWMGRLESAELKLAQIVRIGRNERKGSTRTTEDYRAACDLVQRCKQAIKAND